MKISIITVNLNNASGLEQTIQSVVAQSYQPIEYIVIDGNSTDGSKTVIEKYAANINVVVSEKDNGVYNAMNKGIANSTGEYFLFLNSGDTLLQRNSLKKLIDGSNNADIVYGNIKMTEGSKSREVIFPSKLSFKFFYINSLPHPCTLIRKPLFDTVGLYREHFTIVSDWLFFTLAICRYSSSYKHVNVTVSNFMLGGLSSTQLDKIEAERKQVMDEYFPAFADDYKELHEAEEALYKARKKLGYRVHRKIDQLFFKK